MKKLALFTLTLVAAMAVSAIALAADTTGGGAGPSPYIALGIGLTVGLAAFGSAFGQGRASSAALEGIARNPAAAGKIQVPMILALVFMEALTLFCFVIAFLMVSKVG